MSLLSEYDEWCREAAPIPFKDCNYFISKESVLYSNDGKATLIHVCMKAPI